MMILSGSRSLEVSSQRGKGALPPPGFGSVRIGAAQESPARHFMQARERALEAPSQTRHRIPHVLRETSLPSSVETHCLPVCFLRRLQREISIETAIPI